MKRRIIDILLVTIGSFIAAVGYNSLLVKNNIASGGVGGLAISLNALFGWNNANFVLATTIPNTMNGDFTKSDDSSSDSDEKKDDNQE